MGKLFGLVKRYGPQIMRRFNRRGEGTAKR
jgi:hypothetical protein